MIFKRKDLQNKFTLVQRIINEIDSLLQSYPQGDFSDSTCITRILNIHLHTTFIRIKLYIQPKLGCFNQVVYLPNLYLNSKYPLSNISAFNEDWIYHPNINLHTKRFAIPNEIGQLPNSLEFTIKYLKFICIEPNLHNVPYNLANMTAALQFQKRTVDEQYTQIMLQMRNVQINDDGDDSDVDPLQMCNMSVGKGDVGRSNFAVDMSYLLTEINQLKIKGCD